MRCLLDTHTYLWSVSDSANLSSTARGVIRDIGNEPLLSIASLWEIAIKLSVGKLDLDVTFLEIAVEIPTKLRLGSLPITPLHLDIIARLPLHHRDPFDRLLVAQCLAEQMAIVSIDTAFDDYGVERLW